MYHDDHFYAELECIGQLRVGACAPADAAIYVYSRDADVDEGFFDKMIATIRENTLGCYDLSSFKMTPKNTGSSTFHKVSYIMTS